MHLELFTTAESNELHRVTNAPISLPQLTYLALPYAQIIPICAKLLDTRRTLTAVMEHVPSLEHISSLELETLADDPRFVIIWLATPSADWQHGTRTRSDFWAHVDALIAKLVSGEVHHESGPICARIPQLRLHHRPARASVFLKKQP